MWEKRERSGGGGGGGRKKLKKPEVVVMHLSETETLCVTLCFYIKNQNWMRNINGLEIKPSERKNWKKSKKKKQKRKKNIKKKKQQ